MKKFTKGIKIIFAVVVLSGAVYAVVSNVAPSVVYECDTSGCG